MSVQDHGERPRSRETRGPNSVARRREWEMAHRCPREIDRPTLVAPQSKCKRRKKVTLAWNADDMAKARYGLYQMDDVLIDGHHAGISMDCGYIANDRKIVSLAVIDEEHAQIGNEVTVVWGENPLSQKPQVEPHEQTEVKAIIAPAPYGSHARTVSLRCRHPTGMMLNIGTNRQQLETAPKQKRREVELPLTS